MGTMQIPATSLPFEGMKIGQLADLTSVSAKTIRYYESIGLLDDPPRTDSGYRQYDDAAVDRVQFIRDAQATGLSLSEIASVLDLKEAGEGTCAHTAALLDRHLHDIEVQIERLVQARGMLRELSDRARSLDPAACVDPNRCQVIASAD